jgi:hypothetical protein
MNNQDLLVRVFEGNKVQFNIDGYINATFIAKKYGKQASKWLDNDDTKNYIKAISSRLLIEQNQLVIVKVGAPSTGGGTWIHPKLGVYFARWISVEFELWCDEQIEQILKEQRDTPEQRRIDEFVKMLTDTVDMMDFDQMSYEDRLAQRSFTWNEFQTFFNMKRNSWFSRCVVGMINRRIIGMSATQFRSRVLHGRNRPANLTRDFLPKPIQECIMWVSEELLDYFRARRLWTRTLVTAKVDELCITKRARMERIINRDLHELAEECIERVQAYAEEFDVSPYEVIRQNLIELNYDRVALQRHFREQAMKK